MPVRKFRSVEEMGEDPWLEPGDPRLERAIRYCFELALHTGPPRRPPGVYKYRSVEELSAAREAWEAEASRRTTRDAGPEER